MRFQKTKAILYIFLIFLCGFLAGAVATNIWTNWSVAGGQARADSSPPGSYSPPRAVKSFQRRLNLSPEQSRQLHQILDETRQAYRQHELEIESIRQQGRARIRTLLNDEQKAAFDEMTAQRDQKRRRQETSER